MGNQTAITVSKYDEIRNVFRSETIMQRFAEVMDRRAASAFISSVLITVSNNDDLQKCTVRSIINSAMRAAALRLSCDPEGGQAYLVPFNTKVKGKKGQNGQPDQPDRWENVCTLVVGYKGLNQMAIRTGKYRFINVAKIREGQEVEEDQLRGTHRIIGRASREAPIIGYLGYFELYDGYTKTIYMTVEEIEAHGARYSKTYEYSTSFWKKNPEEMREKTVIRKLLKKWGYLDPHDALLLDSSDEAMDSGEEIKIEAPAQTPRLAEGELLKSLGFDSAAIEGQFRDEPAPQDGTQAPAEEKQPQPPAEMKAPEFWQAVGEMKFNRQQAGKILAECGGAFGEALAAIKKQAGK